MSGGVIKMKPELHRGMAVVKTEKAPEKINLQKKMKNSLNLTYTSVTIPPLKRRDIQYV